MIKSLLLMLIITFMLSFSEVAFAAVTKPIANALETANGYMDELDAYSKQISQATEKINSVKNGIMGPIQQGRKYLETAMEYQQKVTDAIQDAQEYAQEFKDKVNSVVEEAQGYVQEAQDLAQKAKGYVDTAKGYAETAKGYVDTAKEYAQSAQDMAQSYTQAAQEKLGQNTSNTNTVSDSSGTTSSKIAASVSQAFTKAATSVTSAPAETTGTTSSKIAASVSQAFTKAATSVAPASTETTGNTPSKISSAVGKAFSMPSASIAPTQAPLVSAVNMATPSPEMISPSSVDSEEFPAEDNDVAALDASDVSPEETTEIPELVSIVNSALRIQADVANYCLADNESEECKQAKEKLAEAAKKQNGETKEISANKAPEDKIITPAELLNKPIESVIDPQNSDSAATESMNKVMQLKKEIFPDREISAPKVRKSFTKEMTIKEITDD